MRLTPISKKLREEDPATAYAMEAAQGKRVVGELVRASCERHLRDLEDGHGRGLVWNKADALRAINFPPAFFKITAGALEGKPFVLLPWMKFITGSLFGWRRADSNRLRFRRAWIETGKGQAKSPLMAVIGLYMFGFYNIPRAQVYAIGQDRATANVLFRDAVAMMRAGFPADEHGIEDDGASLVDSGDVIVRGEGDNAWKLEHAETSSIFQALANGEAISGPRPCLVLADEIHEFKTAHPIETWARAIAKMGGDAMMIMGTNTPATTQIIGTEYSTQFQRITKGDVPDDEAFAFIARVDVADHETVLDNEACWEKALPSLDITYPRENIRGEVLTAKSFMSTALSVKRLHFGIPIGTDGFWIAEHAWNRVKGEVDPHKMKGRPCHLSLDLSQKNDLTALAAVWEDPDAGAIERKEDTLHACVWYWTTREGLEDRSRGDNAPYDFWVGEGYMTAVPGAVIDYTFVAQHVAELCAEHDVRDLCFDVAFINEFIRACEQVGLAVWRYEGPEGPEGHGLKLIAHAQGTRVMFEDKQLCMPLSIRRLEDRVLDSRIVVDSSPVTQTCAANAVVIFDGQKNKAFDKKKSRGRIDGLVVLAMGTGAATAHEIEIQRSAYDVIGAEDAREEQAVTAARAAIGDDGTVDMGILQDPTHPMFATMARRFNEKMAAEDLDSDY